MSEPAWYVVHEEEFRLAFSDAYKLWGLWAPAGSEVFTWRPVRVPVLRDANATAGTWPEVATLPYRPMWLFPDDDGRLFVIPDEDVQPGDLLVPLFDGDPERAVWRRRKWWGDGPVKPFSPWGVWFASGWGGGMAVIRARGRGWCEPVEGYGYD